MKTTLFAAILIMASVSAYALSSKDFNLEGTMGNPSSPQGLTAVINGELVKKGEVVRGCVVEEIGSGYAVLRPENGGANFRIGLAQGAAAKKKAQEEKKEGTKATTGDQPTAFVNLLGMAKEAKIMSEMKQIFTAAQVMATRETTDAQGNYVPAEITLEALAESGLLPKVLASGRSDVYIYTVRSNNEKVEVYGDPDESATLHRHLMIDSDGVWHAERGKQATARSPTI